MWERKVRATVNEVIYQIIEAEEEEEEDAMNHVEEIYWFIYIIERKEKTIWGN